MQCHARAFLFSGRPDPTWHVEADYAGQLAALWERLEPCPPPAPAAPRLGYRGVSVTCAVEGEFVAFAGVVTRATGSAVECRKDVDRRFERLLLSTAPEHRIPAGVAVI